MQAPTNDGKQNLQRALVPSGHVLCRLQTLFGTAHLPLLRCVCLLVVQLFQRCLLVQLGLQLQGITRVLGAFSGSKTNGGRGESTRVQPTLATHKHMPVEAVHPALQFHDMDTRTLSICAMKFAAVCTFSMHACANSHVSSTCAVVRSGRSSST